MKVVFEVVNVVGGVGGCMVKLVSFDDGYEFD